jgi:adenylylsulfate kinase
MDTVAELNPPPSGESTRQAIIAVDFDGVIGPPRGDVVEALIALRSEGWKIIVYSCRSAEEIGPYMTQNRIPFDEINPSPSNPSKGTKPRARVYWDDRAYCYSGNAVDDLEKIRKFRTWSGRI